MLTFSSPEQSCAHLCHRGLNYALATSCTKITSPKGTNDHLILSPPPMPNYTLPKNIFKNR